MSKTYDSSIGFYKNRRQELNHLSTRKLIQLLEEVPELTVIQEILDGRDDYFKGGFVDRPLGAGGKINGKVRNR